MVLIVILHLFNCNFQWAREFSVTATLQERRLGWEAGSLWTVEAFDWESSVGLWAKPPIILNVS